MQKLRNKSSANEGPLGALLSEGGRTNRNQQADGLPSPIQWAATWEKEDKLLGCDALTHAEESRKEVSTEQRMAALGVRGPPLNFRSPLKFRSPLSMNGRGPPLFFIADFGISYLFSVVSSIYSWAYI